MRLGNEQLKALQAILLEELGLDYDDERAQEAGMAIMRFVIAKRQHKQERSKPNAAQNQVKLPSFKELAPT